MKNIYWIILNWFYGLIRFLYVEDIDPNEDYHCGYCRKPVLTRLIFCSESCEELELGRCLIALGDSLVVLDKEIIELEQISSLDDDDDDIRKRYGAC